MVTQEEIVLIKGKRSKRPRPLSPLELTRGGGDEEEKDMANCLMLLAKGQTNKNLVAVNNYYQCKTCDKRFSSFQALGGHRASHTKSPIFVKPITTMMPSSEGESTILSLQTPASRIGRVHECSICGTGFASGQALGGHMRRHRPLPTRSHGESSGDEGKRVRTVLSLDLNLPAPEDNYSHDGEYQPQQQQQLIVFTASSLVGCHY